MMLLKAKRQGNSILKIVSCVSSILNNTGGEVREKRSLAAESNGRAGQFLRMWKESRIR